MHGKERSLRSLLTCEGKLFFALPRQFNLNELYSCYSRREMSKVRANAVFQSLVMGLFWSSGKLIVLFAVLCFVLTGNDLSAERIFVAVSYLHYFSWNFSFTSTQ